jgi:hypothetical protein
VLNDKAPCLVAHLAHDALQAHVGRRAVLGIAHQPLDDPLSLEVALEGHLHLRAGDFRAVVGLENRVLLPVLDLERSGRTSRHRDLLERRFSR